MDGASIHNTEILRSFKDVGGLTFCPPDIRISILKWLMLVYLGEPGGRTSYGNVRHVFYSNTAAPLVQELISSATEIVRDEVKQLANDPDIKRACRTIHIERRLDELLDLVVERTSSV